MIGNLFEDFTFRAMIIHWASMGIKVEKFVRDQKKIYISVPEHSYIKSPDSLEMCGDELAKNIQIEIKRITNDDNFILFYRIRKGVFWDEIDSKIAFDDMRDKISKMEL